MGFINYAFVFDFQFDIFPVIADKEYVKHE
jgi:hypothetical protein